MALDESFEARFQRFIEEFKGNPDTDFKYDERIAELPVKGTRSLVLDFNDLYEWDMEMAQSAIEDPQGILSFMEGVVYSKLRVKAPEYAEQIKRVHIRFRNLPLETNLRSIGAEHISHLIMVHGIIVRATQVQPLILKASFICPVCTTINHIEQGGQTLKKPPKCFGCDNRKGFELVPSESEYIDSQTVTIQECPEDLPPGQLPRSLSVELTDDLVNIARPGDRVTITGMVVLLPKYGRGGELRKSEIQLDTNHIEISGRDLELLELGPHDEEAILELSRDPFIFQNLQNSFAPSIYGYPEIKDSILYLLFGGVTKELNDVRLRGDINVLLVGDPGCYAKGTLISMGDGTFRRIETLGSYHLQEIHTPIINHLGETTIASRFHVYENQPILEVITETGRRFRGDPPQPIWVKRNGSEGWVKLKELQVGDACRVKPFTRCEIKSYVPLNWTRERGNLGPKPVGKLPDAVTPKLAAIIALLSTDGYVGYSGLSFGVNSKEEDKIPFLASYIWDTFRLKPSIYRRPPKGKRKHMMIVDVNDVDLQPLMKKYSRKVVPDEILASGNEVVAEYLRWIYDADATCLVGGRGRTGVNLKCASNRALLEGVQLLLTRWGIHSRIIGPALFIRRAEDIIKFHEHIGFISAHKRARLEWAVTYAKTRRNRRHDNRWETIKAISEAPPETVYDIEVPRGQSFHANCVASHNTGKSQMLQHATRVSPRGLFTTGRGSTAAGLTAAVVKEGGTGGFVLEAGALVLADKGVCAIDEFEKMRDEDRGALHPAMEQQIVPIAKGGIVATLNARASILAAANPTLGRYNPYQTVAQNLPNLPVTLLSRFDLIFIIKDIPDPLLDNDISDHIIGLHMDGGTSAPSPINNELLRKYISYAKQIKPKITEAVRETFKTFYGKMRKGSIEGGENAAISITPRQLESLVRIAEARARAHLRNEVSAEDATAATIIMEKSLSQVGIDIETGQIDIDVLYSGKSRSMQDRMQKVLTVIVTMGKTRGSVHDDDLYDELESDGMKRSDAAKVIKILMKDGTIYAPRPGYYKPTSSRVVLPRPSVEKPTPKPTDDKNLQEEMDRVYSLVMDWRDGLHTDMVASELGITHNDALKLLNLLKREGLVFQPPSPEGWWKTG